MLQDISIKNKLILIMGFLILISVIIGGAVFFNVQTLQASLNSAAQAQEARSAFVNYETTILNARKNLAEFVNSGDLSKKEQYLEIWTSIPETEKSADQLVLHIDEELKPTLDEIHNNLKIWQKDIVTKQLSYMQSPQTVDLARLYEASEENNNLWSAINNDIKSITTRLEEIMLEKADAQRSVMHITRLAVVIGNIITLAAAIGAAFFLILSVSKPLTALVEVTGELVNKNWKVTITGEDRKDEVGQMANALVLFRDNGEENERLQEAQKLEDEKRLARARRIEELVDKFRTDSSETTSALDQATRDMKNASALMTQIASDTTELSTQVSSAANETGANVQSVSAATEELTNSINEISEQLNKTSVQASTARDTAEVAVSKMTILEESVNDIAGVIDIITDIAEQTNLLALNATIESARAGEAGKGFAVVANEVKNLANETAKATEDVRKKIEDMQGHTKESVQSIQTISKVIDELSAAASSIAAAMEEQTSATQEISRNVNEAASGTNQVVQSILQVNKATEETGETSGKVNTVSDQLATRSESLKSSISQFINDIKAA